MSPSTVLKTACGAGLLVACGVAFVTAEGEPVKGTQLPTGQFITPLANHGAGFEPLKPGLADFPDYTANGAMSLALSPDRHTLLVLTSGYNRLNGKDGKQLDADSNEYVFVYDVSAGTPRQEQVLEVPNSFAGIAFAGDGRFYVAGGQDDEVHSFAHAEGHWLELGEPIRLGHAAGNGREVKPMTAGLAPTADGQRLVVANYNNDSISVLDLATRQAAELDLRPGKDGAAHGTPGGEYPFWVAVRGNDMAYVSCQREREVDVVDISGTSPKLKTRIKLAGTPNKMLLDRSGQRLFVALDNGDAVAVVDTGKGAVSAMIPTLAPAGRVHRDHDYRGVAPNDLALSADETRLYVTNGGTNSVAVVALDQSGTPVLGLIPTGWYPQGVAVNGSELYVINAKSPPGPNPGNFSYRAHPKEHLAGNQYILQLEKAGLLSLPLPTPDQLKLLTEQVLANNGFLHRINDQDRAVMAALHQRIKHVIYIIKENRTYDQVLGDLGKGNGDPALAEFGAQVTPNYHALAGGFVDLDNFYCTGEVSGNGWPWSTAGRDTDVGEKTVPVVYAGRSGNLDTNGDNRNINVAEATAEGRHRADPDAPQDPDLLPGSDDVAGPDGPEGEVDQGYLWDAALRAGLSVRNYGMYVDTSRYDPKSGHPIPLVRMPVEQKLRVSFANNPTLIPLTDPYYRSFDTAFPDFYREKEWRREFDGYVKDGKLPALSLLWMMEDHMGSFGQALDGVNRPELQQADNDYAVAKLIEAVAHSRYKSDTLIFILEDDAQDGPDHVDAHRSTAYIVGPYVKHGAVVSDYYSTVSMLRTIEDVLGIEHLSIFDADVGPMADVFDLKQADWDFTARPSSYLANTQLPIPPVAGAAPAPSRSAAWWRDATRGMDFSREDRVDAVGFNRLVWAGLKPGIPYPTERSGRDLRDPPGDR